MKMTNKMTKVVYFQPAQTTFSEREPLNVLLVADSPEAGTAIFRFFASAGAEWKEVFLQEKAVEKGHTHLYFQLPARSFGAEIWGEVPEELSLSASANQSAPFGNMLLFHA